MTVSAHDVARELRERVPGIGVLKLHKLLYFAQAWHLARTGRPLFRERIEAWAQGPVVATLWADEKYDRSKPEATDLDGVHLATVEYVTDRYGKFTGVELKQLTHREGPWCDLSESDTAFGTAEITHGAMQEYCKADREYRSHVAEVNRMRQRRDVYSFDPLPRSPDLEEAVDRATSGERVRHTRT